MADSVRDVVIRLNLESGEANIQAPDMSAIINQLKEELRIRQALETQAEQAMQKAQDSAAQLAAAEASHMEELNEVKTALQELAQKEKEREDAIRQANEALQEQEQSIKDNADATLQLQDATKQMLGVTRKFGDGALSAARALTILGNEGGEEVQELMHKLLQVQAVMDAWKGLADITEGVIDSVKAMKTAQEAANTAQSAGITLSNTATASAVAQNAATVTLTASLKAMWVAMAPIAIAMAKVAAVAAVLYGVYKLVTWNTQKAKEEAEAYAEKMERQREAQEALTEVQIKAIKTRSDEQKQLRDLISDEDKLKQLREAGLQQQLAALDASEKRAGPDADPQILEMIAAKREAIMVQIREQHALEQKNTQEIQDQIKRRKEEIKAAKEKLEVAKQALETERQQTQDMAARFGAMSAIEQAELKALERKKQAGTLTAADAKRFIQLDSELAGEGAQDVLRKKGEDAGIGGFSAVQKRRTDEAKKAAAIDQQGSKIAEDEAALEKASVQAVATAKQFMDGINDLMEDGIKKTAALKHKQDQVDVAQAGRV